MRSRPILPRAALVASALGLFAASALPAQNFAMSLVNGAGDEHIDVPATPFAIPPRGITVEAWILYDDATIATGVNRWPTIVRHTDAPNQESFIFRVQAGTTAARRLAFAHRNAANQLQEVDYTFTVGEFTNWTHVAATFDGSTSNLYVDGVLVDTANTTGPIRDGGGTLRIGNGDLSLSGAEVWNGQIDEVRIWPYARTREEILETKDVALVGIPNGLTFNLDGSGVDTSQGILGVETSGVTYVAAQPLPVSTLGVQLVGPGTTNCAEDRMLISVGSRSRAGNTDFEFVFVDGPENAAGGVLLAGLPLAMPFTFLGVDFRVDLGALIPLIPPVTSDANGVARLPVALTASTQLGLQLYVQALFVDAVCGTNGAVSSAALGFTVF